MTVNGGGCKKVCHYEAWARVGIDGLKCIKSYQNIPGEPKLLSLQLRAWFGLKNSRKQIQTLHEQ